MCNLYSMTSAREAVLRLFRVGHNRAAAFEPLPAIFPGHGAPVIRKAQDGERELSVMSWGYVLPQPDKVPRRVTNCRDDKARASRFWRDSFEHRRCLVPATSFCEPNDGRAEGERATWHWFALNGNEPRPLFAFAGLWRRHQGPVKKAEPPVDLDVFAFLTTTPNPLVATINHERMPVLLTSEAEFKVWTEGTPQEAFALARELAPERMRIVQAGFEKEDLLAAG
jgi:putative SOS response-associated peptidase YedK